MTFAPPSDAWRPVSPKLTTVKRITASIWLLPLAVVAGVIVWLIVELWWASAIAATVPLLWWLWLWFRAPRWVRSWGWARRDADLCITHGLWHRSLLVVPFGRMQVVKVSSGPLQRKFGLATVQLVTAAALSGAEIPGLPLAEAQELRDLLIEMSDAQGSGL